MQSLARICLIAAVAAALVGCGGKEGAGETPKSSCSQVSAPSPNQALTRSKAPSGSAPATATWDVIVKTNCGSFGFSLEARTAPNAAAAFAQRVETGFYDGLAVHRIAPGFVIQGGDPLGDGTGGPGYVTVDAPPSTTSYPRGTVAMAKSADQAAGTAGSQFFVVTGESATLPPDYAVIGKVSSGMDVVDSISTQPIASTGAPAGAQPDGPPARPIVVERMTARRVR